MLLTLFFLFIVGPLIGLTGAAPLRFQRQSKWRKQRMLMWGIAAGETLALVLFGTFVSSSCVVFAIPLVLGFASFLAYREDEGFRTLARAAGRRSLLAGKVLVFGGQKTDRDENNGQPDLPAEFFAGDHAPRQEPAPAAAPLTLDDDVPLPVVKTPAPVVEERPPLVEKSRPTVRSKPTIRPTEQQILEGLLRHVDRLMRDYARPESERVAEHELKAEASAAKLALTVAVEKVQTGTVDWTEICSLVSKLERLNIPAEILRALDRLIAERGSEVADGHATVRDLSSKLRDTRGKLDELAKAPVLTAEEVIASADEALAAADRVSVPQPQ